MPTLASPRTNDDEKPQNESSPGASASPKTSPKPSPRQESSTNPTKSPKESPKESPKTSPREEFSGNSPKASPKASPREGEAAQGTDKPAGDSASPKAASKSAGDAQNAASKDVEDVGQNSSATNTSLGKPSARKGSPTKASARKESPTKPSAKESPTTLSASPRKALVQGDFMNKTLTRKLMYTFSPIEPGDTVCITSSEDVLRRALKQMPGSDHGEFWHDSMRTMLGQEYPVSKISKDGKLIYLEISEADYVAGEQSETLTKVQQVAFTAQKKAPLMQRNVLKEGFAFPREVINRVYAIAFELDGDTYSAKVLDKRTALEAEVGRKRGMTHLIEYVSGPEGPGGREWVYLNEHENTMRDNFGHHISYMLIDLKQQRYPRLHQSLSPGWEIEQNQKRRCALRQIPESIPDEVGFGGSPGGDVETTSHHSSSAFSDLSSLDWSAGSDEDENRTPGRRVPPGAHCSPNSMQEVLNRRLYYDAVNKQAHIDKMLMDYKEAVECKIEAMSRSERTLSEEEKMKTFTRLYGDADERKKNREKLIEEKNKRDAIANKMVLSRPSEKSDRGVLERMKIEEVVQKMNERRLADKEPAKSWSPVTKTTAVAERLHAEYLAQTWRKEARAQWAKEREEQYLFDSSVHAPSLPAERVRSASLRLHRDAEHRRHRWRESRQALDDMTDIATSMCLQRREASPYSTDRTRLLFEDASRRKEDKRLTRCLKDKQDDEMLRSNSVHRIAESRRLTKEELTKKVEHLRRSKNKMPGGAFTRMVRASCGIDGDSVYSGYSRETMSVSSLWSALNSPSAHRRSIGDFSVGIWCPPAFHEATELEYKTRNHGEKRSYVGAAKLQSSLSQPEVDSLCQFGSRALRERQRREARFERRAQQGGISKSTSSLHGGEDLSSSDEERLLLKNTSTDSFQKRNVHHRSTDESDLDAQRRPSQRPALKGAPQSESSEADVEAKSTTRRVTWVNDEDNQPRDKKPSQSTGKTVQIDTAEVHEFEPTLSGVSGDSEIPKVTKADRKSIPTAKLTTAQITYGLNKEVEEESKCSVCSGVLQSDWNFCRHCGTRCSTDVDYELGLIGIQEEQIQNVEDPKLLLSFQVAQIALMEGMAKTGMGKAAGDASPKKELSDPHRGAPTIVKTWEEKEPFPMYGLFIHEDFGVIHMGGIAPSEEEPSPFLCRRPIESKFSGCLRLSSWPVGARSRCLDCQMEWERWAAAKSAEANKKKRGQQLNHREDAVHVKHHTTMARVNSTHINKNFKAEDLANMPDMAKNSLNPMKTKDVDKEKKPLSAEERDKNRAIRLGVRRFSTVAETVAEHGHEDDQDGDDTGHGETSKARKPNKNKKAAGKTTVKQTKAKSKAKPGKVKKV